MDGYRKTPENPNPKIGSIERVGQDGYIVESWDPDDADFSGGKRLFGSWKELAEFLENYVGPRGCFLEREQTTRPSRLSAGSIRLSGERDDER